MNKRVWLIVLVVVLAVIGWFVLSFNDAEPVPQLSARINGLNHEGLVQICSFQHDYCSFLIEHGFHEDALSCIRIAHEQGCDDSTVVLP